MRIFFYGHNCFLLKKGPTLLVIDPWFSKNGAFYGSWFQYPNNHYLKEKVIQELVKHNNSYIFISHEHQDHLDLDFINSLVKKVKIIVPKYRDNLHMLSLLSSTKHEVIELDNYSNYKIGNELSMELMISDIGVDHDCAVIVDDGTTRFLNQNDCKIYDQLHKSLNIDVYSVQYSGANWFPSCYEFAEEIKEKISKERVEIKLSSVLNGIRTLEPKAFIPAAGPAIFPFLESNLSRGIGNIFVHQDTLDSYLKQNKFFKTYYLNPGEEYKEHDLLTSPIPPPSIKEIADTRNSNYCIWDSLKQELNIQKLISQVKNRLLEIADIKLSGIPNIQLIWDLDSKYEGITIDLNRKSVSSGYDLNLNKYYRVCADKKYFALMSEPKNRWQDISLSFRATIKREPKEFCNEINLFLFSDIDNIRDSFLATKNISLEKCIVSFKGNDYEINRYCPHQGADLRFAEINEDCKLICPKHGWEFDIKNKGHCSKSNSSIEARKYPK